MLPVPRVAVACVRDKRRGAGAASHLHAERGRRAGQIAFAVAFVDGTLPIDREWMGMGRQRYFGTFSMSLVSLALAGCGDDGSGTAGLTDSSSSSSAAANSSTTAAEPTTTGPQTTETTETTEVVTGGVSGTTTGGTAEGTTGDPTGTTGSSEGSTSTGPAPFCGDGKVDDGEECDDANADDSDPCTSACKNAFCGDGIVGPGEACDDGNMVEEDDCGNDCASPNCGDGKLQVGVEECDDGNLIDTDACLNSCLNAACGDGTVQEGVEECDDANADDLDACSNACVLTTCDDAIANGAETDVDCGGPTCPKCGLGAGCVDDGDCEAVCMMNTCFSLTSCKAIHDVDPALPDGEYTLDPDDGGPAPSFAAHCDMTTSGGGWTLVARVNGTDMQGLLYDVWTAGATVGDIADFNLVAGGDALYPSHTAVLADELMFLDATAPCGGDNRLVQTAAILGDKPLRQFLADVPALNVTYLNADPALGANVSVAAFLNKGCVHPLHGAGNKFPMNKFGVNISMTTHNANAFIRFTTSPNDWDIGIGSKLGPDGGYQCGDMDPLGDGHNGWPGHIVTVYVR
jgi:cysteine-rich repeat protein